MKEMLCLYGSCYLEVFYLAGDQSGLLKCSTKSMFRMSEVLLGFNTTKVGIYLLLLNIRQRPYRIILSGRCRS
jgi:hypothetical protein